MNNLIFKGKVDETEVGQLAVGMPMEIVVGAAPDMHPTAEIEYIAPKGTDNAGANTFEIKAALHLPDSIDTQLRAGYSANATVILSRNTGLLTVPESVVEFRGDSCYVYVLTDSLPKQIFERRAIDTGVSDGINIEVRSGVDSTACLRGERITE